MPSDPVRPRGGLPAEIRLSVAPAASLAVCELLPLVRLLRVENRSGAALAPCGAELSAEPPVFLPFTLPLPGLGPMDAYEVPVELLNPVPDRSVLSAVKARGHLEIRAGFVCGGSARPVARSETELLPPWTWPGLGSGQEASLAYFAWSGKPPALVDPFFGKARGGGPSVPRELAARAWKAVCLMGLKLSGRAGSAEAPRPGERRMVLSPEALIARGEGTALDMAVLFAGVFLAAGLEPSLAFAGRRLFVCLNPRPLRDPVPWQPGRGRVTASAGMGYTVCFDPGGAFSADAADEFGQEFSRSSAAIQSGEVAGVLDFRSALAFRNRAAGGPPELRYPQVPYPQQSASSPPQSAGPDDRGTNGDGASDGGSGTVPFRGRIPFPDVPDVIMIDRDGFSPASRLEAPPAAWGTPPPAPPSWSPDAPVLPPSPMPVASSGRQADEASAAPFSTPPPAFPPAPEPSAPSESLPPAEFPSPQESSPPSGYHQSPGSPPSPPSSAGGPDAALTTVLLEVREDQPPPEQLTKFETWKRRLLDLSNRNSLLNFRSGRIMVDIVSPDLPGLEDRLASRRKFDFAAGLEILEKLPASPQGDVEVSAALMLIAEANRSRNVLLACCGEQDLNRRLLALYRQARTALQEGGSNILFMAIGFLAWTDGTLERQAPLILVPVTLARGTAGSRFRLEALEDETRFNLTLVEKLRTEHSIGSLDGMASVLPRDDRGLDVASILDRTAGAVSGLSGWRVTQRVTLGLFSFSKHLMWRDLSDIEAEGRDRSSDVLNLLINRVPLPAGAEPFMTPDVLDDELSPADEHLPLRADSTQLAAVMRAARGGSFVLIGPPGTGKSQTIANMIAQCVAVGMTVLFVAEKAAALNVVHRRLQAQGLGGFCLELHSNRTDKLAVVRRLHEEAASPAGVPWPGWITSSKGVARSREALNAYARSVHRASPSGMTPFSAMGGLLTRWGSTDVELGTPAAGGGVLDLSAGALERMLETAGRLGSLCRATRGKGSLMRYLGAPVWTPEWEERLCASAARLVELSSGLDLFGSRMGALSVPGFSGTPLAFAGTLVSLAGFLPWAEGGRLAFVADGPGSRERARIAEALRLLEDASAIMAAFAGDGGGGMGRLMSLLDSMSALAPVILARGGWDRSSLDIGAVGFIASEALAVPELMRPAWELSESGGAEADAAVGEVPRALDLLRGYAAAAGALEGNYYMDRALALDLKGLSDLWDSADGRFFLAAWRIRRRVRAALASAMTPGAGRKLSSPRSELEALAECSRAAAALDALPALSAIGLRPGGGAVFTGRASSPEALSRFRDALVRLRTASPSFAAATAAMGNAAVRLRTLLEAADALHAVLGGRSSWGPWGDAASRSADSMLEGKIPFGSSSPDGTVEGEGSGRDWAVRVADAKRAADAFALEAAAFMGLMGWGGDPGALTFGTLARVAGDALEFRDSLNGCVEYLRLRDEAAGIGLGPFAEALESGAVAEGEEQESVRRSVCARFVRQAMNRDPSSLGTTPADRGNSLALFRKHYEAKLAGAVGHVRGLMRPPGFADAFPRQEMRLLEKEFNKKRRHLPVRRLLASLPVLVRTLTPCLLMSPQSVAQYLPADCAPFDLVVFDEASQIPSADAVGALARGRRSVVVGDPKQLPPTDFFAKKVEVGEDPDEADEEPLESILDDCLAAGFPRVSLGWHYRSRSESLISFSNGRYYGGGLVTFPSPDAAGGAVSMVRVDGVYERGQGRSRTNPIEAEAVAAEAVRLLRSPGSSAPGFSVGVVTFNAPQQELIENLLERERLADPSLERFFDDALEEPVIVKNLENIQGDERGHVLFSVGYGPDELGKMTMNFGPLNKPGGERRLNVAITRARLGVKLFASFSP
ncbi:MAG: DUF4011 domain-containing protein, partial [Deltaproteobacteria bacterium]|nr:DUF4011 domain-containing protein [Deltaproteobacteria bacterium]